MLVKCILTMYGNGQYFYPGTVMEMDDREAETNIQRGFVTAHVDTSKSDAEAKAKADAEAKEKADAESAAALAKAEAKANEEGAAQNANSPASDTPATGSDEAKDASAPDMSAIPGVVAPAVSPKGKGK